MNWDKYRYGYWKQKVLNAFTKNAEQKPGQSPGQRPADLFNAYMDIRRIADHVMTVVDINPLSEKAVKRAWNKLADTIKFAYQSAERNNNKDTGEFQKLYNIIADIADRLDFESEDLVLRNLPQESRKFLKEHGNSTLEKIHKFLYMLPLDRADLREDVLIFKKHLVAARNHPYLSDVSRHLRILTDPSFLSQQHQEQPFLPPSA